MILERIKTIIEVEMGFTCPKELQAANFVNDLGMDSLDLVELTLLVEREFTIYIDDNSATEMSVVGDLIEYVGAKNKHLK